LSKLVFFIFLSAAIVYAQPKDMQVMHGQASMDVSKDGLSIYCSDKAVLHWDQFSINANETVQFIQPSDQASVLNRVTGGEISSILGELTANGSIYLINPNGVFIGEGAKIIAAFFAVSTLEVLDEDFLKGKELLFNGSSESSIENYGSIEGAKGVFLIAQIVDNEGKISSEGTVGLTAAERVLFSPNGKRKTYIDLGEVSSGKITHRGTIQALAAEIQAGGVYERAIQTSGTINAIQVHEEKGRVFISCPNSINEFSGDIQSPGGNVTIVGDKIHLKEDSLINVSGDPSGEIYIGGGYQGSDPNLQNSTYTFIESNVQIKADGIDQADGGSIIAWSDGTMCNMGTLSARGGESIGDGGFIEVSGKAGLHFPLHHADVSAKNGSGGTLLLDPDNITIQTGGGTPAANFTFSDGAPDPTIDPGAVVGGISTFLNAGNNLTLEANDTITFSSSAINATTGSASLFMRSGTSMTMNAAGVSITLNGGNFVAEVASSGATPVGAAVPRLFVNDIATNGGDITLTTGSLGSVTPGGISLGAGTIDAGGGNIVINGTDTGNDFPGVTMNETVIQTNGSGTIDITGSNLDAATFAGGIRFAGTGAAPTISTVNGDLTITAINISDNNIPVAACVLNSNVANSLTTTGTGSIHFEARISGTGNQNLAIVEQGAGTSITTNNGQVTIVATNSSTGTDQKVIQIQTNDITINDTQLATITASNTNGGTDSEGVRLESGTSLVMSNTELVLNATASSSAAGADALSIDAASIDSIGTRSMTFNLTGGSGANSLPLMMENSASITSESGNITINGTANGNNAGLTISDGSITTQDGTITLSGTASGTSTDSVLITNSGTVNVILNNTGSIVISPETLDCTINNGTVIVTGSGSLLFDVPRDLYITGGTNLAEDATITSTSTGNILLKAGRNIQISEPGAGSAVITQTGSGNITFVTDNLFPTPFEFGTGAFILNAGTLTTNGGELRIYSSQRSLNTVATTINSKTFVPGPLSVDSNEETFGVYFSEGSYGGPEFNFYYKRPFNEAFIEFLRISEIDAIYALQVALAQLSDSLSRMRDYRYVSRFCSNGEELDCMDDPYNEYVHWHFSWSK
jgi:filamentous hemagglutinin family protein